jgi:hypothetical protein
MVSHQTMQITSLKKEEEGEKMVKKERCVMPCS